MAVPLQSIWRRSLCGAVLAGLIASGQSAAFAQQYADQQSGRYRPALIDKFREAMSGESDSAEARSEDMRPLATPRRSLPLPNVAAPTQAPAAQVRQPTNQSGKRIAQPPTLPKRATPPPQPQPQATAPPQPLQPTIFDAGTHLQLNVSKPTMIFSPAEKFDLTVIPNEVEVYPEKPIHCRLQIFPTGSNQILWTDEKTTQATKDGVINEVGPFKVPTPPTEGSYELAVLFNRQDTGKPGLTAWTYVRKVQFAVVASQPVAKKTDAAATEWKLSQDIDLRGIAPPSGDESLLNLIPGLGGAKKAPIAHSGPGKLTERKFLNGTVVEIPARGWRAVPLTIRRLDRPHLVEIQYPDDQPQSAAIAVLEPNQTSGAGLALDHGWESPAATAGAKLQTHRFAFWPSSPAAVLLIANRENVRPLAIHSVRVLAGGDELPPSGAAPDREERLVASAFNDFSLLDAFSARIALDQDNTPVADWKTWHDAGARLTQYLRHAGFNGASLPIVLEGGALYPSKHFPSYVDPQRGIAALGPKDLQEKDVVELWLQMFDREGLRLVTTVNFTSPLPELEKLVQAGEPGILLDPPAGGIADDVTPPRYNPLHPQVQAAIAQVIEEIVSRYGKHPSFGGVAVAWSAESYARLPGPLWGADELTLSQFFNDEQLPPPELNEGESPLAVFARDEQLRERWLKWRAMQLTGLYLRCGEEVAKAEGPARLYLLGGKLLDTPAAREAVDLSQAPTIGWRGEQVLLEQGIDAELCKSQDRLTIVRPQSAAAYPRTTPSLDELRPGETDRAVASAAADGFAAAYIEHPTKTFELQTQALDKTGLKTEQLALVGQSSPTGAAYRRAWLDRLAAAELHAVFVGGAAPPFGREESVRDFITALRKLPAVSFESITSGVEPIVARVARAGDKLYLTLTNNSPWSATVNVAFEGEVQSIVNLADDERLTKTVNNGKPTFRRILQPFDFVAIAISGKDVQIGGCRTAIDSRFVEAIRREAEGLRTASRGGRVLNVPQNPGFEAASDGRAVPGWQLRVGEELSAVIGEEAHSGKRALHIVGAQEDTVFGTAATTAAFAKPAGKRFALRFVARTESIERDHVLRVLIEAGPSGGAVLQSRDFGPESQTRRISPISGEWTPCEIPLDGIPDDVRQLRIRFVFRGTGGVWIDDLQFSDEGLSEAQREELSLIWSTFDDHLAAGRIASANQLLRSAWPQYVKRTQGETPLPVAKREEPVKTAAAVVKTPRPSPSPVTTIKKPLPPIAEKPVILPAVKDEEVPPLAETTPAAPVAQETVLAPPSVEPVVSPEQPVAPTVPQLPPPREAVNPALSREEAVNPALPRSEPVIPPPANNESGLSKLLRLPELPGRLALEQDELNIPATAELPPVTSAEEAPPRPSARKTEAKPKETKKAPAETATKTSSPLSNFWNGWLPSKKTSTEKR